MSPGDPAQRRCYKANLKKHSNAKGNDIKIYIFIKKIIKKANLKSIEKMLKVKI